MNRYNPKEIEPKWQKTWDDIQVYKADLNSIKPKYISMSMFNYPSGAGIHIGHAMNYTISDVLARFKRQQGYESYHPVGWDAFGLPAENYAIKAGVSPQQSMATIIPNYHKQYKAMGWSNDWSKEISTHLPNYYKWSQWIFSEMHRASLAYQDSRMQWWCSIDNTVLANEQVINGKCWRHDAPNDPEVTKREVKQWFFKTTDYADELLEAIDDLDWTEGVKLAQKNWIGKSVGAEIDFKLADAQDFIKVFTTRPDTLFGATFMVLAPEHDLVGKITTSENKSAVDKYVAASARLSEVERQVEEGKEKSGVFTGAYVVNPATDQKIPIWIADYVLMGYGTGAVMAVPGHDQRDYEFAKKFDLPIVNVVNPVAIRADAEDISDFKKKRKVVVLVQNDKNDILTINWGDKLGGRLTIGGTIEGDESVEATALREVTEETGYSNLEVVEVGQETFYYKYYAFSKQEAHEVEAKFIHLRLKSDKQVDQSLDESEKGNFKVEWVDSRQADKEIVEPLHRYGFEKFIKGLCYDGEGLMTNSGIYNGMSSAEAREKIIINLSDMTGKEEPTFVDNYGSSAVREGQPFVERDAIVAIVKHWKEDKYLGLKWKEVDWETVITGGVEEGQTAEQAAIAEIREETGYLNPVLKKHLGVVHCRFFHPPKNVNRLGHFTCIYFELKDGQKEAITSDEQAKHEVVWLTREEMENFHLPTSQRYTWDKLMDKKRYAAKEKINYKMRDWSVSRQRYWGAPIPIIHCKQHGAVLVPDEDLPVVLPEIKDYAPSGDGRSALARATQWLKAPCPTCGKEGERETDTLDTYIDSSWYMLRYFDPTNETKIFDSDIVNKWMPIDFYNGADHATAHMIYARFVTRFFYKQGLVDNPEPFKKFLFNGKVTASNGQMFSKSKGNGVDPLEIIEQGYGADALRTYLMFAAPLELWVRWDPQGVPGTYRFLNRVWTLVGEFLERKDQTSTTESTELLQATHRTIQKVSEDLQHQKYNTAIAASMQLTNDLYKLKSDKFADRQAWQFALDSLVMLIAPFAPHIADELWHQLGHEDTVHIDHWPVHADKYLVTDTITIAVQVNGKLRATLDVDSDISEAEVTELAKKNENVAKYLDGKVPKKTVHIPGKLVNFVV